MVLALILILARAHEQPPLSVVKVQALIHYLDYAKSKFECLTVGMMNGVNPFSKLSPALVSMVIYGTVIYAFGMATRFVMCTVMALLDWAVGTHVFEALLHLVEGLNTRVLPALPGLNGLLGLLVGFSIVLGCLNITINIIVDTRHSRIHRNKMSAILSRRSQMIEALPKGKYGCLIRRSDDVNRNNSPSSSSSCAICLGCIGEEDGVRILPNCRHYFHISCIDRWLLPSTVNNSSCPMCRATVISIHSSQAE